MKKIRRVNQYLNSKFKYDSIVNLTLHIKYMYKISQFCISQPKFNRSLYKALLKRLRLCKLLMHHGREFHNRTSAARNDCLPFSECTRGILRSLVVPLADRLD